MNGGVAPAYVKTVVEVVKISELKGAQCLTGDNTRNPECQGHIQVVKVVCKV